MSVRSQRECVYHDVDCPCPRGLACTQSGARVSWATPDRCPRCGAPAATNGALLVVDQMVVQPWCCSACACEYEAHYPLGSVLVTLEPAEPPA